MMKYLETNSLDPYYNLAFEEYILLKRKDCDYLILWQNRNTIVIGKNQDARAEINSEYVRQNHINVVRRSTGGGTVYHDEGNINFSLITDAGEQQSIDFKTLSTPIVNTLIKLGISAECSGRNDIIVDGCKVSGTAQRITGGRILHHGTLLYDSDLSVLAECLKPDPIKFQSKGAKSVRSRVANIKSFLATDMSVKDFWKALLSNIYPEGIKRDVLSEEELEAVRKLRDEKYATEEWNYRNIPTYTITQKKKYDGGILEVRVDVKDNKIKGIELIGDFMARKPIEDIQEKLIGTEYTKEAIGMVLKTIDIQDYFGGIRLEEIVDTIGGSDCE